MIIRKLLEHSFFVLRFRYYSRFIGSIRNLYFRALGMKIGSGTYLPVVYVTWPNQVRIGKRCQIERNIHFKFDGIWSSNRSIIIEDEVFIGFNCEFNINSHISIGKYSNIASGCKFVDHDHGMDLGIRIGAQPSVKGSIKIGEDVWLGANVIVLKGVSIGNGAIVAAGAVVNKSIPENEVWAGVPCKFIRKRTSNIQVS